MSAPRQPIIIGLAGGIGSGKSTVARAFARLGFVVIDSDAEARAALDRPDVRATLAGWWGPQVLNADGSVNRAEVARRAFADERERLRLEGLIHPLVRKSHAQAVELARQAPGGPAPGVVMDTPLLFEAGLDRECDAVVFIEASRSTRFERVRRSRAWDQAEFDRREASQWPLEKKRAGCRFTILNDDADGSSSRLDQQVQDVCATLVGRAGNP